MALPLHPTIYFHPELSPLHFRFAPILIAPPDKHVTPLDCSFAANYPAFAINSYVTIQHPPQFHFYPFNMTSPKQEHVQRTLDSSTDDSTSNSTSDSDDSDSGQASSPSSPTTPTSPPEKTCSVHFRPMQIPDRTKL